MIVKGKNKNYLKQFSTIKNEYFKTMKPVSGVRNNLKYSTALAIILKNQELSFK